MVQISLLDHILFNATVVPAAIGYFRRKTLERPFLFFVFYLILGTIAELTKLIFQQPIMATRIVNYLYYLMAFPVLSYCFLLWSNKPPLSKSIVFFFSILVLTMIEIDLRGMEHKKVSFVSLYSVVVLIFFATEAFVVQLGVRATRRSIKPPLLFILPQLVVFLNVMISRIMMVLMYDDSTAAFFMDLWRIFQFINLGAFLCFSLGILWAPNKEKYLTLTGP